jgi:hypothetical protein
MNPLIQLNRLLQYLFIALLLACFAMPAMGEDKTPNHKEIFLISNPPYYQVPCVGEYVDIRGLLKLKFGLETYAGKRQFMPVKHSAKEGFGDLAKGYGQVDCPDRGQCDVGRGQPIAVGGTGRKYMADPRVRITGVETNAVNGDGDGECKMFLLITGVPNRPPQADVCPNCPPVSFKLFYNLKYKFKKDKKGKQEVTSFNATPAIRCN